MPIITDINVQKKRNGYYNVFVDGKFSFSISDLQLSNSQLSIGQEYSQSDLLQVKNDLAISKQYTLCLNYLSRRLRSEWELRDYLRRKEVDQEVIDKVIEKLIKERHVDDLRFAQTWIGDRNMIKPRSKKKLKVELMEKRIAKDIIIQVLDSQDNLQELVNLKRLAIKKLPFYRDRNKLTAYLVGQGFDYSSVKTTLDDLMTEYDKLSGDTDYQ